MAHPEDDPEVALVPSSSRESSSALERRSMNGHNSSSSPEEQPLSSSSPPNNTRNENEEEEDAKEISLAELMYSAHSFHAIVTPVSLTMILTALCVVFINTEETIEQGEEQLASAYTVYDVSSPDQSTAETLGLSLANALIIVSVICAMTFVIVLLYKYRCMKLLIGYMVLSSSLLLGFLGGLMFEVAVDKYNLGIDKFSFYYTLWNFAAVGTAAIFWQLGIPYYITQLYLIATSVILAWQLSHFDAWTSWTLLIMLALYDLCAVLTPCGPLKALVNLMSEDDSPDMPGLLYEAHLPEGARRPSRRNTLAASRRASSSVTTTANNEEPPNAANSSSPAPAATSTTAATASPSSPEQLVPSPTAAALPEEQAVPLSTTTRRQLSRMSTAETSVTTASNTSAPGITQSSSAETRDTFDSESVVIAEEPPTGTLPFAIAKLYKLPLVQEEPSRRPSWEPLLTEESSTLSPNELLQRQYTPQQLCRSVEAIFPRNGGRIDLIPSSPSRARGGGTQRQRYQVKDRHGNPRRVLLVDDNGRVLEEQPRRPEDEEEEEHRNSIRLGLGDFIFYSVLVSKAVQYSFTTFAACMLVILTGLGGTLVLLAVYRHALPALPISIFLGVVFYLLTRALIEPWIEAMLRVPYYV